MLKKIISIFLISFFSSILYASENCIYKAELIHNGEPYGFIDIPYTRGDKNIIINSPDILAQIDKKHKNSMMLKPSISLDRRNNFFPDDSPRLESMPDEKRPLKFFLQFPMDSGSHYRENFLMLDVEANQLKEGEIISITQEYEIFKDAFCGKLFIKLNPTHKHEYLKEQIQSRKYKIISSNPEEINTGRKSNFTLSSCMPYVVVLLVLCVTNFYSYQIGTQKNRSTDVGTKK